MADAIKYQPIYGGVSKLSDIKSLFSIFKTRRTVAFAYGLMFAFVLFTGFLIINPASSSSSFSPMFSNFFTSTSPSTSNSSPDSYRSHFSSIYSYFFPNTSSPQEYPPQSTNFTRSTNTTFHLPFMDKSGPSDPDRGEVMKTNETRISSSQPPILPLSPSSFLNGTSIVKNQTLKAEDSYKSEALKPNRTITTVPKPLVPANQTDGLLVASSSSNNRVSASNLTVSLSSKKPRNKTTNSGVSVKQGKGDSMEALMKCNLYDGEWVRDDSYPLYKPGSCPLIDEQFDCALNGRPDHDYHKLKWKPKGCTIPRLDGSKMLNLLRGKRLVFVGDSLNRNMWESLVCILRNSVKDKSRVFEAHGRHSFRGEAAYSFIFKDYDCSVEFFVSPFLVQEWEVKEKTGSKKETLRLDLVGRASNQYKTADIIVFNTGHWWTHEKTSKGEDYYQEGSHVYKELNVLEAFRKALTTWGRWIDSHVNPLKSTVFFRGYSASHFSGGQWNSGGSCDRETEPIKNTTYLRPYPAKMTILEKVLKGMKTRVRYLNVTTMTDFRKDGHPSMYRKRNQSEEDQIVPLMFQDCSHWCLPGVPDAWNEVLYAELLVKQNQKQQQQQQSQKQP